MEISNRRYGVQQTLPYVLGKAARIADFSMTIDPLAPPPMLTAGFPGIGGRIKHVPEDFEVEEIPAYAPSGTGDFLYLWIEKRDMGAEYFVRQIARRLDIRIGDVGVAGMKDRRAVTRQMVSVPASAVDRVDALNDDGVRVLSVQRHTNKLRTGHLHGNRFRVLVRDVSHVERLDPIVHRLRQEGVPNFYGPQRFGHDGETWQWGMALLRRQTPPPSATGGTPNLKNPFLRKLALSAAQAGLFNDYLARRLEDGYFRRVLQGDVMGKWPYGGMFVVEDAEREQQRFEAREIVHAGPIFGRKTFPAGAEAAEREAATLADAGLTKKHFTEFGKLVEGTRRHNLFYVDDLEVAADAEGVRLTFTLPAGSYATVLIRELTKSSQLTRDDND